MKESAPGWVSAPLHFLESLSQTIREAAHAGAGLAPGGPGRLLLQVQAQTCCLYTQTWPKVLKTNCRPRAGCQTGVSSESEWLACVCVRGVPAAWPRGTGHWKGRVLWPRQSSGLRPGLSQHTRQGGAESLALSPVPSCLVLSRGLFLDDLHSFHDPFVLLCY